MTISTPDSNSKITHFQIDNLTIHHFVYGDGASSDRPPILMLHGWGANIELLRPLAQRLAPLGYAIYAPDLPGFGDSAPPPTAWTVFDYADFVLRYLDSQQITRAYLFGHSFGGRLGLILGAEHADRIVKMALADSAGVIKHPPLTSQIRLTVYKSIRDGLKIIGLGALSERLRVWYSDRYGSSDFKNASGVMRETFVKVVNQDLLPYAARVKPSTLLLWGDRDQDTPLADGKLLEKTIPDAGLVIYEGAGHYSYLDRLADAVRVIDYFFRQA